jgi:hypothetical protein
MAYMDKELARQVHMKAVEEVPQDLHHRLVISPVFTVPKKGSDNRRGVINLKWINSYVKYVKFKATTMRDVKAAVEKDCWMTTIDLRDAFWNVPVHPDDRRFLAFRWRGKVYWYRSLPFGLTSSPRILHKVLRPLLASFHIRGLRVLIYVDDLIIFGKTKAACTAATKLVQEALCQHGFVLNTDKSQLQPSQIRLYLGCTIDSVNMRLTINKNKMTNLREDLRKIIQRTEYTARRIASTLWKLTAMADCLIYNRVHTTGLHQLRLQAIRNGWDQPTTISREAKSDALWWRSNLKEMNGRSLIEQPCNMTMDTDASKKGWGAYLYKGMRPANGKWNQSWKVKHINLQEMKAVHNGLLTFRTHFRTNTRLQIRVDSMTAFFYLARMGGRKPALSRLATTIFELARVLKIEIMPSFIPTEENVIADDLSRHFEGRNFLEDYTLHRSCFLRLDEKWGPHSIDLHATFANAQLPRFAVWKPDSRATWVNSMHHLWTYERPYSNPPFSQIMKILHKVEVEQVDLTIVAPLWPAQPWFTKLVAMAMDIPILLPSIPDLFLKPVEVRGQPQEARWPVLAWRVSGRSSKQKDFRVNLSRISSRRGVHLLTDPMKGVGPDGRSTKKQQEIASSILKSIRSSNSSPT